LLPIFRFLFEDEPRARAAEVLLCTMPLWLCCALRLVSTIPVLALDLPEFALGAFPEWSKNTMSKWGNRMHTNLFFSDLKRGPPLKSLFVREDLMRGYHGLDKGEPEMIWPFVALNSLYISARYPGCNAGQRILVMRAGSQMRFASTMRGRLFFATLLQFETMVSPWHFRMMHESDERLSYEKLADHRAAVWVPLNMASKMTLKDLQTLEIPMWVPGHKLQTSISSRQFGKNCRKICVDLPAWACIQCREVRIGRWLPLSPLFRYPFTSHFDSLSDLVVSLSSKTCDDMQEISDKMRAWNRAAVASDQEFWRSAILGLHVWNVESAVLRRPSAAPAAEPPRTGLEAMPYRTMQAWPPRFSNITWWAPVLMEDGLLGECRSVCGPMVAYCLENDYDVPTAKGYLDCCQEQYLATHGPLGPNATLEAGQVVGAEPSCLTNMSLCSDDLLRFGLTLTQDVDGQLASEAMR